MSEGVNTNQKKRRFTERLRGVGGHTRLIAVVWLVLLVTVLVLVASTVNAVAGFQDRVQTDPARLASEADSLQIRLIVQSVIILFLAGLVIGLLLRWLVRRTLTGPLSELNAAVEQLGTDQAELSWPSIRGGEVGRLAGNLERIFGQLLRALSDLEEQLSARTSDLQTTSEQLAQAKMAREKAEERLESAQRAAEAAERTKSDFVSRMSHELRTPLSAIIGYSELLQEQTEELYAALTFDLQKIRQSGTQLLTQVNDVLSLSELDAGEMELCPETFELQEVLDEAVDMVRPAVKKNGNELTVQRSPEVVRLCADRTQLRRMLIGLLDNAAKFTQEGQIRLTVEREPGEPDDWIVFRVADTGIGIAPERVDELFEPFAQGDTSTTRLYGGSGLGLTLVQRFCQMMGGSVSVESDGVPGEGSVFTVRLPERVEDADGLSVEEPVEPAPQELESAEEPAERSPELLEPAEEPAEPGPPPPQEGAEGPAQLGPKIDPGLLDALSELDIPEEPEAEDDLLDVLADVEPPQPATSPVGEAGGVVLVVDDDPAGRETLTQCLTQVGFDAMTAASGEEGLLWTRMRQPDLVALNVLMSEMDGWAALHAFKSDPEVANVPVFMLAMEREGEGGWALGLAEYLSGAEDCHRLARMVKQYLPGVGAERAGRALLVENKPDLRQLLEDILKRDGWQVSEAENDQQAAAQLEAQTPDVVVLDLMVPELDHLYFLARLRRDPARRSVPVVFFAAKEFSSTSRQRYNDYVRQVLQERASELGVFTDQVCQLLTAHVQRR